jgi:predicted transglutaminase-like cysteine proteinase
MKKRYGYKAEKRLLLWKSMMEVSENKSIVRKLKNVNDFFNKFTYKRDIIHWRKEDYWATPIEFIGTGAGDSEDYAIAKYYSLLKLGILKNNLKLSYVNYKGKDLYEKEHVVLYYYHKSNSKPIVLDIIDKSLKFNSKRSDLQYNSKQINEYDIKITNNL